MMSTTSRPPVQRMSLQLFRRAVHPELYETFAERVVQRDDYTLTVRVTNTGHVLLWQTPTLTLTEVIAPVGMSLPQRGRVWRHPFEGERNDAFRASAGISYQMSAQVERLHHATFYVVHQDLLADSRKRGLVHVFATPDEQGLAPLGFVTADARPGCLVINSFHTFPADATILKTQTLIERVP